MEASQSESDGGGACARVDLCFMRLRAASRSDSDSWESIALIGLCFMLRCAVSSESDSESDGGFVLFDLHILRLASIPSSESDSFALVDLCFVFRTATALVFSHSVSLHSEVNSSSELEEHGFVDFLECLIFSRCFLRLRTTIDPSSVSSSDSLLLITCRDDLGRGLLFSSLRVISMIVTVSDLS